MPKTKQRSDTWGTSYDKYGDPSGEFCASRQGFIYLRSKIDEALSNGEAKIGDDAEFDFDSMKLDDIHPLERLTPNKIGDSIFRFVVISIGVIAAGLMAYGAHQFWQNFMK